MAVVTELSLHIQLASHANISYVDIFMVTTYKVWRRKYIFKYMYTNIQHKYVYKYKYKYVYLFSIN